MSSLENSDGNDDETGNPGTRPIALTLFAVLGINCSTHYLNPTKKAIY
jgi:hypothetical protein